MIPVTQTKVVVKNSKDEIVVRGNCFAACIASLLQVPITEVPNVEVFFDMEGSYWIEVMMVFLNHKKFDLCTDNRYKCFHKELTNEEELSECSLSLLRNNHYLVSGKSKRGIWHMCIYQNGKLVHDPHPTREGLETLETFQTLEEIK